MKAVFLLAVFFVVSAWAKPSTKTDQIYCYYTSWAIYRTAPGKYTPADVDPKLCTIINYAFIGLWGNGTPRVLDDWADIQLKQLPQVVALKEKNPKLKVILSMGGWNEGSVNYSNVAADPALRKVMVQGVVEFVKNNNFDGFDLDWEYPTRRGGSAADRENFSILLKELKEGLVAANKNYILTVAVLGVGKQNISEIYDPVAISKYADFINLMLYDFHTPSEISYTFQGAAVSASTVPSEFQSDYNQELSVIKGIETWLALGGVACKINLGIPFYGHSWTLADNSKTGLFAPATGPGTAGKLTAAAGTLSYQEICLFNSQYTVVRDTEVVSPYQYSGNQWVSYEDAISVAAKAKIAKKYGLAGVMIWDLDYDDFNNACGQGTYPLLKSINSVINASASSKKHVCKH